jgi:hypothetical protein
MFKKIVSSLPFSTTYVAQLGPFARTLKKEDIVRKITLTFMLLTLVVQMLIVLQPTNVMDASDNNYIAPSQNANTNISESMTATNITQGFVDASSIVARPNDLISYTASISNLSSEPQMAKLSYSLYDALNYASLYDSGGGNLDNNNGMLSWQDTTIEASSTQTRTFILKVNSNIVATAQSKSQPNLYDCMIGEISESSPKVKVECPSLKFIEKVSSELPTISAIDSIVIALTLITVSLYFHERTRQLKKEIRLIRKDSNIGTV